MDFKNLPSLFFVIAFSSGHQIKFYNNCTFTVWPGIQGDLGQAHLEDGGFQLDVNGSRTIATSNNWSGKIWGRTGCNATTGSCETGDCGNKIQCKGDIGESPATFAEMEFSGPSGRDFYKISLTDGYNLPMKMEPTGGYEYCYEDEFDCKAAGCITDVKCPPELAVILENRTVACKHPCAAFDTDEYCCRNEFVIPKNCRKQNSQTKYIVTFKAACPNAFSYFFDDDINTNTCRPNPATKYTITFCP